MYSSGGRAMPPPSSENLLNVRLVTRRPDRRGRARERASLSISRLIRSTRSLPGSNAGKVPELLAARALFA